MKRLKERKTKQLLAKTMAFAMLLSQVSGSLGSISVYADVTETAEETESVAVSGNGKKVSVNISETELMEAVETAIHEGLVPDRSELQAVSGNLNTETAWRELLSEGTLYAVPLLSEETTSELSADDVEVRFYVQKDSAKLAEKAQKELVLYGEDTELSGLLAEFADMRMASLDNASGADAEADADYVVSGDEKITVLFLNHSSEKRTFTLTVNGEKAVKNLTVSSAEASMKSVLNSIKGSDFSEEMASASDVAVSETEAAFAKSSSSDVEDSSDMEMNWKQARKEAIKEARENIETIAEECTTARYLQFTLAELTKTEKNSFIYSDDNLTVTAVVEKADAVPAAAELRVQPITEDSAQYAAYMEALNTADNAAQYSADNTRLYDIAFFAPNADGEMTELKLEDGAVNVKLSYKKEAIENGDAPTLTAAEDLSVLHLPVKQEVKDAQAGTATTELDLCAEDITVEKLSVDTDKVKLAEDNEVISAAAEADENSENAADTMKTIQSVEFKTEGFSVFAIKTGQNQTNTWSGTENYSVSTITNGLGNLANFAVAAKEFDSTQHVEGNIYVGTFKLENSAVLNAGDNIKTKNKVDKITIRKKLVGQENDAAFNFAIMDGDHDLKDVSITTSNHAGELVIKRGNTDYADVFNALDRGANLKIVEKNADAYDVSYTYSDALQNETSAISGTTDSNYIGEFVKSGNHVDVGQSFFGSDLTFVGTEPTDSTTNGYVNIGSDFTVQNTTKDKFKYVEGLKDQINEKIDNATALSANLAQAKNGVSSTKGGLNVINLISTTGNLAGDLDAANFTKPYIEGLVDEDQVLLVNIDATDYEGDGKEYNLNPQEVYYDGKNPQDHYNELGRRVVYNFVTTTNDHNTFSAFAGTVRMGSHTAGMVLAPAATVDQTSAMIEGTIIAATAIHSGQEIHKTPIVNEGTKEVVVDVVNTKKSVNLSVTKALQGRDWKNTDKFAFKLTPVTENAPMPEGENGTKVTEVSKEATSENRTVYFGEINYTEAGKYIYQIQEQEPGTKEAGMTYDTSACYAIVTITKDTESGKLVSDVKYSRNEDGTDSTPSLTVINTYNTETTERAVQKVWDDADNQDGKRPASLSVDLMNGTTKVNTVTLSDANDWRATVSNLPKTKNGNEIVYTWKEASVEGYTQESAAVSGNGEVTTLTNKHTPELTDISVKKVWADDNNRDGLRPEAITVKLLANGKEVQKAELSADNISQDDTMLEKLVKRVSVLLNKDNGWQYTFKNLPKYQDGKLIIYSIEEVNVEGYTGTVEDTTAADGSKSFTLTNTHETTKVNVKGIKNWDDCENQDGKRPTHLMLYLYADGKKVQEQEISAEENWQYTFDNLDKYNDGREIRYEVKEEDVKDYYQSAVTTGSDINDGKAELVYTLTNCHKPETVTPSDIPDVPDKPNTPTTPDTPNTPDTPTTPDATVPENPTTPTTPTTSNRSYGGGGGGGSTGYHSVTPQMEEPSVLGESRSPIEVVADAVKDSPVGHVLGAVRKAVQTGDESRMAMYAVSFIAAAAALGAWLLMLKRRREK